jgi:tetratricopeptide (TPR) repeat protein
MQPAPDTRESLIVRLRDVKNESAWEEFVSICRPVIVSVAVAKGLQPNDAEDLAQQVLQLHETKPSFSLSRRSVLMSVATVCIVALTTTLLLTAPQDEKRNESRKDSPRNQSEKAEKFVVTPNPQGGDKIEYADAEEAYRVGAAFYNSRSFKNSRAPFEAAIRLAKDDEMKLKAYQALLSAYREIPEFEPFQTAAEFVIANSPQSAERSLTRRAFLSFAYNRGQLDNLAKRYEAMLEKDKKNYLAVYVLSEIYSTNDKNPKRAVELLKQLEELEAKKDPGTKNPETDGDKVKIAREKAKLAQQYVASKEYKKAAKLYEEIAPLDPTTNAWNLKEAASAWLKDKNKKEALRVAEEAEKVEPEKRNDQLAHFFHRNLGDIFMQLNQPKKAIPHFEIAIKKTNIEGYLKDTKSSLAEAIEKSKK